MSMQKIIYPNLGSYIWWVICPENYSNTLKYLFIYFILYFPDVCDHERDVRGGKRKDRKFPQIAGPQGLPVQV